MQSPPATLEALDAENRRYEDKFGHVFLIAASGRTGDEILAELRRRMSNDPAAEFTEAKRELRKITLLRLEKIRYP
jgi:2-oxo-4-hydroxy-4-carboxy--5-ureidoimidazoline (OHCU) decarboxylase